MEESENALKERNKVIRITVSFGCDVVDKYLDDSFTDNSEDATKLRQTENIAKPKSRDKTHYRQRSNPYNRNKDFNTDEDYGNIFRIPVTSYSEETSKGRSSNTSNNVSYQSEYKS